jgi:ribosomal protein L7Ae-like RNA K-turn-binding protein
MNDLDEQQSKRIAGYLGIAQKAGKIAAGDKMVKDALLKNRVELLVLAGDASQEVRSELTVLAENNGIEILNWPNKIDLGLIVGKSQRGALGVLDAGIAGAIKKVKE